MSDTAEPISSQPDMLRSLIGRDTSGEASIEAVNQTRRAKNESMSDTAEPISSRPDML